ncbi:MAG: hypothetical protein LQ348_005188 [Seirophora lacunosa]|nr:MAG: hypothetical protein LQ344_001597 [Seirophora lacunosa]KAI4180513.1 MAG: hypothetical protein LQ348_005188 [Seirophora lacunosa]
MHERLHELAQSERSDGRSAQQSKTESESAQDDDSGGKPFPKGKVWVSQHETSPDWVIANATATNKFDSNLSDLSSSTAATRFCHPPPRTRRHSAFGPVTILSPPFFLNRALGPSRLSSV